MTVIIDDSDQDDAKVQYDEWGVNKQFNNPRSKGIKETDIIEANKHADYYYDIVGLIPIPCIARKKTLYLMKYADYYKPDKDMSRELFDHLKETGVYSEGIAVICGLIKHGMNKGKYFNFIDFDNSKGRDLLCTDNNGVVHTLKEMAKVTIVETNKGSNGRGHLFLLTEKTMKTKLPDSFEGEGLPRIEIYGEKHIAIVANSLKYEKAEGVEDYNKRLYRTEIVKTEQELKQDNFARLPICYNAEETDLYERTIDQKLEKYGLTYLNNDNDDFESDETFDQIIDENNKTQAGGNRQLRVLKFFTRFIRYMYTEHEIFNLDEIKALAMIKARRLTNPPLEKWELEVKWKAAVQWKEIKKIIGKIEGEDELVKELESLGVSPNLNIKPEIYPTYRDAYEQDMEKLKLNAESSMNVDALAKTLIDKYHFKTFEDSKEVLYYNGKIYARNGEPQIGKAMELMQNEEIERLERLISIKLELNRMLLNRYRADMDVTRLIQYEPELVLKTYEEDYKQMKVRNAFVKEVTEKVKRKTLIARDDITIDKNTIVVNNGIIKLKKTKTFDKSIGRDVEILDWNLTEHTPDHLAMNLFPVDYDPKALCPNFSKYLNETCKNNPKLFKNIIKMLGYCIYKSCEYQCGFMLYGDGNEGKSVLLLVISAMLGRDNVCSVSLQDLCDGDKFFTSQLFGKTANIFYDMPFEAINNTSNFKALVVGDPIDGQYKNQPIFTFRSYAKQAYSTNRIPKTKEDTYAYYRRWVLLHFKNRVPEHLRDTEIINILTTPQELSGILNLALKGLKLLIKEGGFETGSIAETRRICESQASLVNEFLDEYYYVDVGKDSEEYTVTTERVQTEFHNYIRKLGERGKRYIKEELVHSGMKEREIDLDSEIDKFVIDGLLGRGLTDKKIEHEQMRTKGTNERRYYYIGLKPKTVTQMAF